MQAYVNVRVKNVDMGVKAGRILYILYLLGEKKKRNKEKKRCHSQRHISDSGTSLPSCKMQCISLQNRSFSPQLQPTTSSLSSTGYRLFPFFTFFVVVDLFVFVKCKTYLDCNYMSGIVEPHFFFSIEIKMFKIIRSILKIEEEEIM